MAGDEAVGNGTIKDHTDGLKYGEKWKEISFVLR